MSPIYTRLGKYEIVRKLGRGGMADVYLALDTEMDRQVALKLIETSSNRDQDTIEAERRGAALQASLADIDSRVAAVHEYDELDGHFYIDMEYVEGEDLSEILRKGSLHLSRVVKIAIEICDMLAQAHAFNVVIEGKEFEGIVHGDIKPRNVRINASDQVKVLDFGIAKALSRTRKLTRNEFGSVAYSSPERLESGDVDVHSDLWSVGVLLYEMVTSIQPYRADSTGKLERLIRDRVPPAPLPADCPQALKKVILKTLAPAIDRRYQSAAQIKADLEAFQDGIETKAELELDSARWWLQGLPGVGVKVAASVLNFSPLNMRALVVDTHVHRVAGRYGLVPASYDTAHAYRALMDLVPDSWTAEDLYELHDFLAAENPRAASDAIATIERAISLLELFPYACRGASGADSARIRELVIQFGKRGYVALFEIEPDDVVTIVAVRHQRESDYH